MSDREFAEGILIAVSKDLGLPPQLLWDALIANTESEALWRLAMLVSAVIFLCTVAAWHCHRKGSINLFTGLSLCSALAGLGYFSMKAYMQYLKPTEVAFMKLIDML